MGRAVSCLSAGRTAVYFASFCWDIRHFIADTFMGVPCMSGGRQLSRPSILSRCHLSFMRAPPGVATFPVTGADLQSSMAAVGGAASNNLALSALRALSRRLESGRPLPGLQMIDNGISGFTLALLGPSS